jgi:hypothetical protein
VANLPEPVHLASREILKLPLTPWIRDGRRFEAEIDVRRLISPPARDVVTGLPVAAGPSLDTP